eukprot:CAMPEP_0178415376 /NCGR_PEP_ID=MMETSP0689_2-20121128/23519_1 /TAXON_ID=160604 /ORGANISM="Amphidinium massartii, Strain CS-259" /LENGTH=192 /DNA_ID=CAMNT_0020036693 /DNA_START=167 /DNA_END=745 /DNA_ORIENTATION=+
MSYIGQNITSCQKMPAMAGGGSMRFGVTTEGLCTLELFNDAACTDSKTTQEIFNGACQSAGPMAGKVKATKTQCSNDAVPAGAWDTTCLTVDAVKAASTALAPMKTLQRGGEVAQDKLPCWAPCASPGPSGPPTIPTSEKEFNDKFAAGGCAEKCDEEGKTLAKTVLVMMHKMDCNFQFKEAASKETKTISV